MPLASVHAEEQKRMFDIIQAMTPEQQQACFALSRWQSASMRPPMPPRGPMMQPGRAYGPGPGYGAQGADPSQMVRPRW